ncbi:MAG: formylglycine-generating enzyme family protein, partial [Myxococcota bacterium]|nr:formylglycine-generating enzyme family protein [Myxococcota bacterium]
ALLVDQLEELVTLSDESEAAAACELLGWLSEPSARLRLLATVRGDFLSRVAQLPVFGDSMARALYFLRPLSRERIREVITGPAAVCGKRFESEELVEELTASTEKTQGGLPLLQFTLAELWDARGGDDEVIRRETLQAIGGVEGALARHADSVLSAMTAAQREASRRVLCALVTPAGTRARLLASELGAVDAAQEAALEFLVRGRLVMAGQTPAGTTYEIAHEVLVRGWPTLSNWLAANAEERVIRDRLRQAVKEWDRLGRQRELLFARAQLVETRGLKKKELTSVEIAFLDASKAKALRNRAVSIAVALCILASIVGVYGVMTYRARLELWEKIEAELSAGQGDFAKTQSQTKQAQAERREALLLFDSGADKQAEQRWQSYRGTLASAETLLTTAGRRFEAALLLDGTREETRSLMADWLASRFLLAEQVFDTKAQGEMLERLILYDSNGSRRQALSRKARITFELHPADARIELFSYESMKDGRLVPRAAGNPSASSSMELAPGSYLAVVTAPGRTPARHPFIVSRGENLQITDEPPLLKDVPPGFVYVPKGRFLYGSAAPDGQRRDFFHTVPLHQRETGAYLVAKRETTYRDWLEYVRALPPPQRHDALPRIEKGGFHGALSLSLADDGRYRLSFAPTEKTYSALEEESIQYEGRTQRATQNWLDLPVSGISVADAEAFAAFLDKSGRVPGARICTELEWERAARGADGREYPHGAQLGPDEANFDDTYGKIPQAMGPDEVGTYPVSDSPLGVQDICGNVWEWTKSRGSGYAARGGSFSFGANSAKATDREVTEPSFRDVSVGLRLCANAPRLSP